MNAWLELEQGRPLSALRHWRGELQSDAAAIAPHLEAAAAGLAGDSLAGLRRQALTLLAALVGAEPGEAEVGQLGILLRGWGDLCLSHAPARAQQHLERAWACGPDAALAQELADLYARQGMASGAHALAPPGSDLAPWPLASCAGLHCQPCQQAVATEPVPAEMALQIHTIAAGQIWVERHKSVQDTHGLAVADGRGALIPDLCRRYPWQWPGCNQVQLRRRQSLEQLVHQPPTSLTRIEGPVLAVADLSAELHYHGQLELLPRLGRAWQQLAPQLPGLRLWHNGGQSHGLQQALDRLGVPLERRLCAVRHPRIQADQLLVPSYPCGFGQPGPTSLEWLRRFWLEALAERPRSTAPAPRALLLSRPIGQRRPLLQHQAWTQRLAAQGFASCPAGPVAHQLEAMQHCDQVVAAHGGALVNLLLAPRGATLLELANPAYAPPYFASLIASGGLRHERRLGAATPQVLQDLLYAGPLEWPINLPPG